MLQLVDIAGIVRGASQGEGLGNQFLSATSATSTAILHVVRCFDDGDITHVDGSVDPIRDIETIDTELMLADLQSVDSQLQKAKKTARTGDKDAKRRVEILDECHALLADGKPARGLSYADPASAKTLRELQLLTSKRVLYVANIEEDDLAGEGEYVSHVRQRAADEGGEVVPVCARLEAELAELDEADRAEMLESVGLAEPGARRLGPRRLQAARSAELLHRGRERDPRLDDADRRDRPASGRRHPHRLRTRLHPRRGLLGRRPRRARLGESDPRGRASSASRGKSTSCRTATFVTSCSTSDRVIGDEPNIPSVLRR